MKKQTEYLLKEIITLINKQNVLVKYEYNHDIEVHFILLYSKTLDSDTINNIADELYLNFVKLFPKSMVAIFDENQKYEFRFDCLFSNLKEEQNKKDLIEKKIAKDFVNSVLKKNHPIINISDLQSQASISYHKRSIYKDAKTKTLEFITNSDKTEIYNEEFALAA